MIASQLSLNEGGNPGLSGWAQRNLKGPAKWKAEQRWQCAAGEGVGPMLLQEARERFLLQSLQKGT